MILLDTCTLLWLAIEPRSLSARAKSELRSHRGRLFVSAISAFEIGQKHARGKLELALGPSAWFPRALELHGLGELPLTSTVALRATRLPDLHRDPFDRILVAEAQNGPFRLVTPDPLIRQYPDVMVVW